MDNLFQTIFISIFASSAVLGIFIFFIKRYLDKLLSFEFDKRKMLFNASHDKSQKTSGFVLDAQLGMYPEIIEIVYRIRNALLHGVKQSHAYKWDPNFSLLCGHITENLYKYQLFLPEDIFEYVHEFKRIAQDALVLCDTFTREDNVADNTEYQRVVKDFAPKVARANELHTMILKYIKKRMASLGGEDVL